MKQDLQRRLVAVMFTDMVGYTALFQADELLAVDKRDRYVRAVEHHHQSFGGTIVKRLGDGSMSMCVWQGHLGPLRQSHSDPPLALSGSAFVCHSSACSPRHDMGYTFRAYR